MLYDRDFTRFREPINKLQVFSRKVHNHADYGTQKFQKFSDNFTLHGFSYIFYRNAHSFERYFWATCIITSFLSTIVVCSLLSEKYKESALKTVIEESQYPVFNVNFPAIALCTKHRVNWDRVQIARKRFLPANASDETVNVFMKFIRRLDGFQFQFKTFENFAGIEDEPLHLIDSINIYRLAVYLSFRCEELMYGTCMWAEQEYDCCKLFLLERTTMGLCMVFNSVVSPESQQKSTSDSFYPFKTSKNGEGSGLIFSFRRNTSKIVPDSKNPYGVEMMVKNADQWTDEKTYHLRTNTYNAVIVKPETTKVHLHLRHLPASVRKCVFQEEKSNYQFIPDLNYRQWNCRTKCRQEYVIRYCNCTISLFFRAKHVNVRECTASDFTCIYKYKNLFGNGNQADVEKYVRMGAGMICSCPPSCDSLNYHVTLNTVPIYNNSVTNLLTRVNVYYQSEVMMKYVTNLKFTIWDLIGYFGGIATLFLGASGLSGVEFLHFALVQLMLYSRKWTRARRMAKRVKPIRK